MIAVLEFKGIGKVASRINSLNNPEPRVVSKGGEPPKRYSSFIGSRYCWADVDRAKRTKK
jgi:hypothetical protein